MTMSLTAPTLPAPTTAQYQFTTRLIPPHLAAAAPDQKPSSLA